MKNLRNFMLAVSVMVGISAIESEGISTFTSEPLK